MILNNLMMKQIILSFCFLSLWNFDLFSQPSFQPETIQNKDGKTIVFRKLDPSKLKKKKNIHWSFSFMDLENVEAIT